MSAKIDAEWAQRIAIRFRDLKDGHQPGGVSLAELEKLSGGALLKSRLGNYLQGTRLMGPYEASILGKIFKVPAGHLLCIDEDMPILSTEERQVISDLRVLNERERMAFMRHLTTIAQGHRDPATADRVQQTAFADTPGEARQRSKPHPNT